jgi:flagellar motor switch/type III secretory pathway protein FliN
MAQAAAAPAPLASLPAEEAWKHMLGLSCQLTVELPLPGFKVAGLVRLGAHSVITTHWRVGGDLPLRVNGRLIGWCEFEVVGNQLAVRITELA